MRGSLNTPSINKQDKSCAHNATIWRVRVTILKWKHNNALYCAAVVVVELGITVSYIKVISVAHQRFYGKFISPTIM
jgi:hypothetical protein